MHDSGVVDEHVEPEITSLRLQLCDDRRDGRGIRHVEMDRTDVVRRRDLLGILIAPDPSPHVPARAGEPMGDGESDPGASPADEDAPSVGHGS